MNKKVIIASQSPVKKEAAMLGFKEVFSDAEINFESINAPSGVSDQPMSDKETSTGALNRCNFAFENNSEADFWIGIEGGIEDVEGEKQAFAWIYIKSEYTVGKARTSTFFLPKQISELIDQGIELGEADDIVFGLKDSKKKNGAVGILTKNIIDRANYYKQAVILALIPFINKDLY